MKLKKEQQRAIEIICHGDDIFVSLPTGFGKSICFHVLPILFDRKLGRMDGERVMSLLAVVISSVSRQSVDKEFLAKLCCIQVEKST